MTMPRPRKRAARKKLPKPKLGKPTECVVLGEQLESVLASFGMIYLAVLPVPISVAVRRNRKEVVEYVEAYVALVQPIIAAVLPKGESAENGIAEGHPKYAAYLKKSAKTRLEAHTLELIVLSLAEIQAEGVRMSGAAIDLLVDIGALLDDAS